MFWKQLLPQLLWDPPFPGAERAWRAVTADVTFPGAPSCSLAVLSSSFTLCTSHSSHGPHNSHPVTVQGRARLTPARAAAGLVSSPAQRAGGPGVTCASTDSLCLPPGLQQGISGQAGEILFCQRPNSLKISSPLPAEQCFGGR